jgi:hypothetical protein
MTHDDMQAAWDNGGDESQMRQIIRRPDGTYRSGDAAHTTYTRNRNEAFVFLGHGATPSAGEGDSIFEILPDEDAAAPAPARRVPAAIRTISTEEAERIYNNNTHDPRIQGRCIISTPRGYVARGEGMRRCPNRDEALIFETYGMANGGATPGNTVEFLEGVAPEPAGRRVPDAIAEFNRAEMQRMYDHRQRDGRHRHPLIIRLADGKWMGGRGETQDREKAHIYGNYGGTMACEDEGEIAEILPIPGEVGIPEWANKVVRTNPDGTPIKRKLVPVYFGFEFIKLMETAPKNEFVRGWILKQTKQMPPDDCNTIEKLEDWLQSIQGKVEAKKAKVSAMPGLEITVDFTGHERGTCRYSVGTYGRSEFRFTSGELESIAEGADSWAGLLDAAKETIADDIHERTEPNMEPDGDTYEYDNQECEGSDDTDWDYPVSTLETRLRDWVHANLPDKARALDAESPAIF